MKSDKFYTPFKKGKNHILYGKPSWNKGKKMPHSKEWEEKRISAVREASKKRIYPSGYKRPRQYTESMTRAKIEWRKNNPDKAREISLRNLSRNKDGNLSGKNSPQWRGGITKEGRKWKNIHWKEYENWRKYVMKRCKNKCIDCGSKRNLEANHIISVKELKSAAFLGMNGVILCQKCHEKTDNYGGKISRVKFDDGIGKTKIIVKTIPHSWQDYSTSGNYGVTKDGVIIVFISNLGNDDFEWLVMMHELIELWLTKKRGISWKKIDDFDKKFEEEKEWDDPFSNEEPGNDPSAPYYKEHQFASGIEQVLAQTADIDWDKYNKSFEGL